MSKLQRIKTMLAELLELEMSSATSDKGVIFWDGELGEGVAVYVEDEEGNKVPAGDDTYEIGNATEKIVIEVAGGVVKTYDVQELPFEEENNEEPETVEEEPTAEPEEEQEEPEVVEEPEEEEPLAEEVKEDEEPAEEVKEEDELRKQIDELREVIEVLKAEVEALKGKPLAMSAAEEFQVIQKNAVTKGIGRYADAIAELRKN